MKFLTSLFLAVLAGNLSAVCACDPDLTVTARPEWAGPYAAQPSVDVNLGNSPTDFVTAAHWQIHGSAPSAGNLATHVSNLTTQPYWRRIDTVNTFLQSFAGVKSRVFSDPWLSQPEYLSAPCNATGREIGGVLMFFFNCPQPPKGPNCRMHWANTHAYGMDTPHALLSYGGGPNDYYDPPSNPGFFYRELMDARYAGLKFLLPNVYGPDLSDGSLSNLVTALNYINGLGISNQTQVGLFDDTWGWTNLGAPFNVEPDFSNPANAQAAADLIFDNKWKPYFDAIPTAYWYRINGRPLIYFYNAGTIDPRNNSRDVINRLKLKFQTEYGVLPWVVVDTAFFDDPSLNASVADSRFTWKTVYNVHPTVINNKTRSFLNGVVLDHAMVKWDPIGRDSNGNTATVATAGDNLIKGPGFLQDLLQNSTDADVLVLAAWNDLGEGTGVSRNYDYYWQGSWLQPNHFMNMIRRSQEQSLCPVLPSTAYSGGPWPIPGIVQAEAFDVGGELVAYHDLNAGNSGTAAYRPSEGIDLDNCSDAGGSYNLSYSGKSEWVNYQVNVATSGNYDIVGRVAAFGAAAYFHIEMAGVSITTMTVSNTGGWQSWQSVTRTGIALSAGLQTMRIVFDGNNALSRSANVNYLSFSLITPNTATPTWSPMPSLTATPSGTLAQSGTPTPFGSNTDSPTPSLSSTLSSSHTVTPSETATPSPSDSPTVSETPTQAPSTTPGTNASVSGIPNIERAIMAPNPLMHSKLATLSYKLSADAESVEIRIYAPSTALALQLKDGPKSAGWASSSLDISGLGNGLYFVRVKAISGSNFGKYVVVKWLLLR